MIRALRDLASLAVLIAVGVELGVLFGHMVYVRGTTWAFAYAGASLFVGFGLVNRLLLHTVIRVVGPFGLFGLLITSIVVGNVALPLIIGCVYRRFFMSSYSSSFVSGVYGATPQTSRR